MISILVLLAVILGENVSFAVFARGCDPSCLKLSSIKVLRKEEGWYVGNYTLLGADGNFFTSTTFPYSYAQYRGFEHIQLKGSCRLSRAVLVYPPLAKQDCVAPDFVAGDGKCGVNGNEKVFNLDQQAADCDGNLMSATDLAFEGMTTVTIGQDDTILQQSRFKDSGDLFQNTLITIGPDGTRLSTTQAFNPGVGPARPRLLSYFREQRVSEAEWRKQLAETRAKFNVLESDYCGWNAFNVRSNTTCEKHFKTPPCPLKPRNRKKCLRKLKRYKRELSCGFPARCQCKKH